MSSAPVSPLLDAVDTLQLHRPQSELAPHPAGGSASRAAALFPNLSDRSHIDAVVAPGSSSAPTTPEGAADVPRTGPPRGDKRHAAVHAATTARPARSWATPAHGERGRRYLPCRGVAGARPCAGVGARRTVVAGSLDDRGVPDSRAARRSAETAGPRHGLIRNAPARQVSGRWGPRFHPGVDGGGHAERRPLRPLHRGQLESSADARRP